MGRVPPLDVIRMLAHASYPVMHAFINMSAVLLAMGKLDPVLREMAIVRTGIMCGQSTRCTITG